MSDRPKKPRAPQDPKAPKKPQGKPKHVEASSTPTKQTQPTQRGQQPSSSKEVRRSPRKLEIRASPEQGRSKPSGKDAIPEQSEGGSPSSSIRRTTRDEPVTHSQAKLPIRDAGLTALDDPTLTTPAPMTRELQDLGGLREQIVGQSVCPRRDDYNELIVSSQCRVLRTARRLRGCHANEKIWIDIRSLADLQI